MAQGSTSRGGRENNKADREARHARQALKKLLREPVGRPPVKEDTGAPVRLPGRVELCEQGRSPYSTASQDVLRNNRGGKIICRWWA